MGRQRLAPEAIPRVKRIIGGFGIIGVVKIALGFAASVSTAVSSDTKKPLYAMTSKYWISKMHE